MTVQNQNVKNVYRGNGSTTVFPFTFAINENHPEYLHVYVTDDGGIATETTDFQYDMSARTITYPKPTSPASKLSATQRLTIYRFVPYEQNLNLVNQGPFFSEDVETTFDDLEMQIQQLSENLVRCFQIGVEAEDFNMTMELEPDKVICVNSEGNGFEAREALMEVNGAWDAENRRIHNVADPAADQDAATKKYADDNFMKLDGDHWEARNLPVGNVGGPVLVKDAATKDYVDRILNGYAGAGERFCIFDTVSQMRAGTLIPSQVAMTLGYRDLNDGGHAKYLIRAKLPGETDNGGSLIVLDNAEYVAELLVTDGTVNVRQFGACGDGTHDDATSIQKALDFATDNKFTAFADGNFVVSGTLSVFCDINFSNATIKADGSVVSPVVQVGGNSSGVYAQRFLLPTVENIETRGGTWGHGTGILILRATSCEFSVPDVLYFEKGLHLSGGTAGCQTNIFHIRQLSTNKINLLLQPTTISGWANQNTFIGGRLGNYGAGNYDFTGSRLLALLLYDMDTPAGGGAPNNNAFYNLDIEGGSFEYSMEICGVANMFNNCRYEGSNAKKILLNAPSGVYVQNNIWIGGYQSNQIKFSTTGDGHITKNIILTGQDNHLITGTLRMHNQSDNVLIAGYDNASMSMRDLLTNTESNKWSSIFTAQGISFKNSDSANAHIGLHRQNGLSFFNYNNTSKYFRIRRYQQGQINIEDTDTNENGAFNRAVILPSPDNTISFGGANFRWKDIYAGTGTIQTSDEREKQDIAPIEDAVFRAWSKVNFVQFRFKDAVDKKGNNARIHFGLIAQRVKEVFESEGLDAFRYGLLCYDEWEDEYEDVQQEDGTIEHKQVQKAGNRYGVRYEEALELECAYQRWLNTNKNGD